MTRKIALLPLALALLAVAVLGPSVLAEELAPSPPAADVEAATNPAETPGVVVAEGGRCFPCDRSCFGGGGTCVERNNGKLCCEGSILQSPEPAAADLPDPSAQCRPCDRLCISNFGTCVTLPSGKHCCRDEVFSPTPERLADAAVPSPAAVLGLTSSGCAR